VGIVKDIKSDGLDIDGVPHILCFDLSRFQQATERGVADVSARGPARTTDWPVVARLATVDAR
jgi:hypothetical protein